MQGVLARIDANVCATVAAALWDMAMCSSCIQAPRSFSERFGAGARPVHPILRLWPQEEPTVTSTDGRHLAVFFLP
jgi:hypothetical protein